MTLPFKIEPEQINQLNQIQLVRLLKDLLHAEAFKFGIAQRAAEVSLNINAGDGGSDGQISWTGTPVETNYLPRNLTMFQSKATDMGPTAYGKEILTNKGDLKPEISRVLSNNGAYIVFTTQQLSATMKSDRIDEIRKTLASLNFPTAATCHIDFYDASRISGWANQFVSTIVSVQEWIGVPAVRGLKTFSLWGQHPEMSKPRFLQVDSRDIVIDSISKEIGVSKACMRIVGLSGLGKTRTAYELFKGLRELQSLVVYADASIVNDIAGLISDWVNLRIRAIVVVDNCAYRLHEDIVREVRRADSGISMLSMDYDFEKVSTPTFRLDPMLKEELLPMLEESYGSKLMDLDRIVSFAQGFPRMAVLLAESRLANDPKIGELNEDELANKLLWPRDQPPDDGVSRMLEACSLFDIFGVKGEVIEELEFLAALADTDIKTLYRCIVTYTERGLIDRRGRYCQVVPKPLAIRLAAHWWTSTPESDQLNLIENIPDSMVRSFCQQIEKLDFHTDVKEITEKLCGPQGPFGQAEVILSTKGSRLFRSFAVVNPEATAQALYAVVQSMNETELVEVRGDSRRNLVWGLEKLCHHKNSFDSAAWSVFKLANSENENYGNNATNTFAQLYRVRLSGTEADPQQRLDVLKRALELHSSTADLVVITALEQALVITGQSRVVGSEYQGLKSPLKDWQPKIWQEIFDYWKSCLELLVETLSRGEEQKVAVLEVIGSSARGLLRLGQVDLLSNVISEVISLHGRNWPTMIKSIQNVLKFDIKEQNADLAPTLQELLKLFQPELSNVPESLKLLVVNPPWEMQREGAGKYIDLAKAKSQELARQLALDIDGLLVHIDILLLGVQEKTYAFGETLILEVEDDSQLVTAVIERLKSLESPNPNLLLGMLSAAYQKSPSIWETYIELLESEPELNDLYPMSITTGIISNKHLEAITDLVQSGAIDARHFRTLANGRAIDHLEPESVMKICRNFAQLSDEASWSALTVIYMYCYDNQSRTNILQDELRQFVSSLDISEHDTTQLKDMHDWYSLIKKLHVENDSQFAISLSRQLVEGSLNGFDFGSLSEYHRPLLFKLLTSHTEHTWPIFSKAIEEAEDMQRIWLQHLFMRESGVEFNLPSAFSVLAADEVVRWCAKDPSELPEFVANCLDVLTPVGDENSNPTDLFVLFLKKFGGNPRVGACLRANLSSRGWIGSLVPHLERDRNSLASLQDHENINVRKWASEYLKYLDVQIKDESVYDAENNFDRI